MFPKKKAEHCFAYTFRKAAIISKPSTVDIECFFPSMRTRIFPGAGTSIDTGMG